MRLFKSSNKSQASLDRLTGSRDHSPTQQPESAYPQGPSYGGPPPPVAYPPPPQFQDHQQQQQQQLIEERYHIEAQGRQHPAHELSRAQSGRVSSGAGDVYVQEQRPTVNIVPPSTGPTPQGRFVQAQTQFGPSQTVRTDKEHKKSKRSIFGFNKDKKEDKEETGDRRGLGRSGSVLRRGGQQQVAQPTSPRQQAPQYTDPRQAAEAEARSSENLPEDPEHYEQYYGAQGQYRQQDQYESPQSQHTRESFQQYAEDPHFQQQQQHHAQQPVLPQDQQYQAYRLSNSANSSDNQLPHQESRFSAATYDRSQGLRPPSQTSLGPPSPLAGQTVPDSRPSTSNTQQRYSTQSQQQQQQQHQHQQQIYQQQQDQQGAISSSQSSTPQPPSAQSEQQPQQQTPQLTQQSSFVSTMGRNDNDGANGRRHETHPYPQQDPRARAQANEQNSQGRNTPPPNRAREDLSQLDFHQLLAKHEELQAKYSKVKRYYFEREAQVTQLQNTVANQRLSMSKTSLDDAGYTTRFDRLNGAIQNFAFNYRKDWRRVPNWLTPVCNRDAHSVGTKEMTAVGRACITRWLYEYVFERIFHPGIDPNLSMHLKTIERVLRGAQYVAPLSSEQQDDLLTKITTWRLTTIEGLQDILSSQQSEAYTETLGLHLTRQLETYLRSFLHDPPPLGLTDGLSGIVHQAIGILRNIPLESRDICIEYYMPGSHLNDSYMKIETGMTPLAQPGSAPTASDLLPVSSEIDESVSMPPPIDPSQSMNVEDAIRESAKAASASMQAASSQQSNSGIPPKMTQQNSNSSAKDKKGGLFGGFVGKKPTSSAMPPNMDQGRSIDGGTSLDHGWTLQALAAGSTEGKIRFAVFLAVEVRGRGVLKENKDSADKSGSGSSKDSDEAKAASAGSGERSATTGVTKPGSNTTMNILCKAPVYAFE